MWGLETFGNYAPIPCSWRCLGGLGVVHVDSMFCNTDVLSHHPLGPVTSFREEGKGPGKVNDSCKAALHVR